ncbi:MAG: squalene--hopene cyclase [Planctomycetes bacterium]|nr:squalene--hopene cyclase [Planctomycetota bacterium]
MKGVPRTTSGTRTAGLAARSVSRPSPLSTAVERAASALYRLQKGDGHWVGELQGDTILESEFIFLMAFLGREREEKCRAAARYILAQQQPDGAWSNYPDGPADLSVSVKAYFAIKLTGAADPASAPMRRARDVIRSLGGAAGCNSFTRFYLALLGQLPYANCPAVPPELVLLPRWFYVNLYAMSSWTRTIVVPLTIFYAHKPCRRVPPEQGIAELFLQPPETPLWPYPPTRRLVSWTNFFLGVDWLIKQFDGWRLLAPLRRLAVRRAAAWLREHFHDSDGVGAIFPPMIYTVISLKCLGVADEAPEMQWALKQLDDLMLEEDDTIRLQPCFSPVWDTALVLNALADAGPRRPAEHEAIVRGAQWLIEREVRRPGDWSLSNPKLEPAGWFFEYHNGHYPDTDDTAMVLMALARTGHAATAEGRPAAERGLRWLLGMQNRDGGWAAFDRDINRHVLTQVPFADHNAMLDPSCPDITARVLEALGDYGYGPDHPQVARALRFLEQTQEPAGGWPGRWGVNYLYGTWQVLIGLKNAGFDMGHPMVRRAVAWLFSVQQPGGGWGESCASYDDPRLAGKGTPTASQTAWALLALLAAGEARSTAVRTGVDWLLRRQRPDGTWHEDQFTGTGFPKVFYLKYHLYSLYFPLMALARYRTAIGQTPALGERGVSTPRYTTGGSYRTGGFTPPARP